MLKKLSKGLASSKSRGFTLIELLVVIAIIAILAVLIIIRIGSASRDARNSRRQADLSQVRTAVEQAKNTGTTVNTTGCAAYPCDRNLADGLFTVAGSSSLPSVYLSGAVYPNDPLGSAYQLRLNSATEPSTNYILRAPATEVIAIIEVRG